MSAFGTSPNKRGFSNNGFSNFPPKTKRGFLNG
jgi:hypothetical protein